MQTFRELGRDIFGGELGRSRGGVSLPYDAVPSITAAYGMRRLRSAYTGNILRLRRSSDNAELDFGYTSSGNLDTAAITTWLGGGSGFVVRWYDQSGNGNNATQATAASQPTYVSQSGGMSFNGSTQHLATGVVPGTGWSMVARYSGGTFVSGATLVGVYSGSNRGFLIQFYDSAGQKYRFWNFGTGIFGTWSAAAVLGMAATTAYINGASLGDTLVGTTAPDTDIYIGAYNNQGLGAANFVTASIQEIVISSATYTAQQVATITTIMG